MATSQVYNAECWGCSVSEVPEVLLTNWNVIHDEECNSRTWIPMPSNTIQYSAAIPKNFKLQSLSHSLQLSPKDVVLTTTLLLCCHSNTGSLSVHRLERVALRWAPTAPSTWQHLFKIGKSVGYINKRYLWVVEQFRVQSCDFEMKYYILWYIYIYSFMCEFFMGLQLLGPLRDPIYLASLIITRNALDTRIS